MPLIGSDNVPSSSLRPMATLTLVQRARLQLKSMNTPRVGIWPTLRDWFGRTGKWLSPLPDIFPSDLNYRKIDSHINNLARQFDPWRESGVSSSLRPGGPLESRPSAPLNIIPGGFHCSDLILKNGAVNSGVQKVIDAEVAQIKTWVAEYYK